MPGYAIGNFLIYVLLNTFTPGPGNILALNTATNYGWRKGRPLYIGIFTGYLLIQALAICFVLGLGSVLPNALRHLKYAGAAYILWLALHIACSRLDDEERPRDGRASFSMGFLPQLVNVKIYFFSVTALAGFVTDYTMSPVALSGFGAFIVMMGVTATTTWIVLGVLLRRFYRSHYRAVNIVLGLSLLECAWAMLR
ncbi:LysE family transporter [Bifidobacterium adolescentis]|uniref:LysE family transporter n=1 Tax=Bifidobacterium adolescentis TaxID=1680 RepID=UPI003CFFF282